MDVALGTSDAEIRNLQRCINDLASVLALPAIWTGGQPVHIVSTLLDALLGMLSLDLIYVRLNEPISEEPMEMVRVAPSSDLQPQGMAALVRRWIDDHTEKQFPMSRKQIGTIDISIMLLPLGLQGEIGLIVAGSRRAGFPEKTEKLVLSIAANQASIGLHEARLLSEQKRLAEELDHRVEERTRELAGKNEELRKEIAERRSIEERLLNSEAALRNAFDQIKKSENKLLQVIDTIPTLAWCNLPDGPNEFLNKGWHEYTGLSPEESHGWGWQVAFHPEDLPALMKKWQELLVSGEHGESKRVFAATTASIDGFSFAWSRFAMKKARSPGGTVPALI